MFELIVYVKFTVKPFCIHFLYAGAAERIVLNMSALLPLLESNTKNVNAKLGELYYKTFRIFKPNIKLCN